MTYKKIIKSVCYFIALFFLSEQAEASTYSLKGDALSLIWGVPFIGLLLSIAFLPLLAPQFWHRHFGKVSAFWTLLLFFALFHTFGAAVTLHESLHTILLEYIPFILIIGALFTITGGIRIHANWGGTPLANFTLLTAGSLLASLIGTTGAAMLLIRPLIRANSWRRKNAHIKVFFIFLVANIGGSLTPLGDPPLFLGFLQGIDFFWTTKHLFVPFLLIALPTLALAYLIDAWYYKQEEGTAPIDGSQFKDTSFPYFKLSGKANLYLLGCVIATVLFCGSWHPNINFYISNIPLPLEDIARDVSLCALIFLSLFFTPSDYRAQNEFSWGPLLEICKLFIGIFITMIPVLAILKAGEKGSLATLVQLILKEGSNTNFIYFWLTGILSSFLDNAPTYLVFFNLAGGNAIDLMSSGKQTLVAISTGAVFMGALTYIGNAPNFMVKSIAEESGIKMPSFFGYILWSCLVLLPCFILFSLFYF